MRTLRIITLTLSVFVLASCYDDSAIKTRLDNLENGQQISAIKASISSLELVSQEVKNTIRDLESSNTQILGSIEELRVLSQSLDSKISELKAYFNEELSKKEEWITSTFCTIEKYNGIVDDLDRIKKIVNGNYSELTNKIDTSISSIKSWVNELLNNYYTSTEVDGRINELKAKLSSFESKLNGLLRVFYITFQDNEIGVIPGGITSVEYSIEGATEKTIVKALGQNGWSAWVTPNGSDKGTIMVKAPDPLTEDEIIVLVYDGEYRTIMSSINLVAGVITPSVSSIKLDKAAGTIDIPIAYNMPYQVIIPESDKTWISVTKVRSMQQDVIQFLYEENKGEVRTTTIVFADLEGNPVSSLVFVQSGSAKRIELVEAGTLINYIDINTVKNIEGLIIIGPINGSDIAVIRSMSNLTYLNIREARIVAGGSYYFENYKTRDNVVGDKMFFQMDKIKTLYLPEETIRIGEGACNDNYVLEDLYIPDCVESIGAGAFYPANLSELHLPSALKVIGTQAFCEVELDEVIIPEKVESIGSMAFNGCKNVHIKSLPQTLTYIGLYAVGFNYDKVNVYIPKGTKQSYYFTELGNYPNLFEE